MAEDPAAFVKNEHERLRKGLSGGGASILDDVVSHLTIDAQVLYREVREEVPGGSPLADKAKQIHGRLGELMDSFDDDRDSFKKEFDKHAKLDEDEALPKLRDALDDDGWAALGERLADAKKSR
jgi:hypothetical protein